MFHSTALPLGGKELIIETGKMAKQANGAVTVRYGDTIVLSAVTAADSPTATRAIVAYRADKTAIL